MRLAVDTRARVLLWKYALPRRGLRTHATADERPKYGLLQLDQICCQLVVLIGPVPSLPLAIQRAGALAAGTVIAGDALHAESMTVSSINCTRCSLVIACHCE